MECNGSAYYVKLLNDDDNNFHTENTSQQPSFSQSPATQDEHANVLPIPSQLGSSHGNTQKRGRTRNFSSQEDLMLVSAWLNVSMDPIIGNDQRYQTYWERVRAYFQENKQFTSDRHANSLMHRWSIIQLAVGKFQGYFNQIEARNQSGVTEQDKICQALEMYKSLQKSSFPFIHCWHELLYAPKFCSVYSKKKSKNSESASPTLSSPLTPDSMGLGDIDTLANEPVLERPIGRKAAKERARKAKGQEVNIEDDTKLILMEIRESQKQQKDERKALAAEFLKTEKDREEQEKKKENREQMMYEQKVLATDTSNMDQFEVEYYTSLKAAIIEKRRNMGFTL